MLFLDVFLSCTLNVPVRPYFDLTFSSASDAPAPNERVNVKISHGVEEIFAANLTTDASGIASLPLTSDLSRRAQLDISTEALTYLGKPIASEDNFITIYYGQIFHRREFILPFSRSLTMRSWYSPSDSFVKVDSVESPLPCGGKVDIPVHFTLRAGTEESALPAKMHYSVVARGVIAEEGTFEVGAQARKVEEAEGATTFNVTTWTTSLSLTVNHAFAPAFKLLVYYVRADGEVIADEAAFQTPECLVNDVTVGFNFARRLPGQPVQMRLKAAPQSLCGFSVVDKSVGLMGTGNILRQDEVFKFLTRGDISDTHFGSENREYCEKFEEKAEQKEEGHIRMYRPWGWSSWRTTRHDSITAFRDAGMLVMTDMALETRPCEKEPYQIHRRVMFRGGPRMEMEFEIEEAAEEEAVPVMAMASPVGGARFRKKGLPGMSGPGMMATTTTRLPPTTTTTTTTAYDTLYKYFCMH